MQCTGKDLYKDLEGSIIIPIVLSMITGSHTSYTQLAQGYRYHKLRKTFGKFFMSYSELLSKFGAISYLEYASKGITHTVFYGNLVCKLKMIKGEANFISSGFKIVKHLRHRQYDPAIIERTISSVLDN